MTDLLVLNSKDPFVESNLREETGDFVYDPLITFTFHESEWNIINNCAGLGIVYLADKGWNDPKHPELVQELDKRRNIVNWLNDYKR